MRFACARDVSAAGRALSIRVVELAARITSAFDWIAGARLTPIPVMESPGLGHDRAMAPRTVPRVRQ